MCHCIQEGFKYLSSLKITINSLGVSRIISSLKDLGIDQRIITCTGNMLNDWVINSCLGIGSSRKFVTKGPVREMDSFTSVVVKLVVYADDSIFLSIIRDLWTWNWLLI